MTITLESIQFRIPEENNGAFNISARLTEDGPRTIIAGPEWLPNLSQPVAFAKQAAPPFIDVSVYCSDMGPGPVQGQIQAIAINGNVLGKIDPVNVALQNGRSTHRITLSAAQINAVGKTKIQWHWQVTAEQQTFTFDTSHDIYTTIGQPTDPWEAAGADASAAPWQEALDRACEWANGATTSEEILTKIANRHYHAPLLKYGSDSYTEGSDGTIEEGIFKLDKFLWEQSQATANEVDCADCATIVALFGGLLGAQCLVMTLAPQDVVCRPAAGNVLVGGEVASPFFGHHEVVWSTENTEDTLVWDFCLGRNASNQAQPYTNLRFHPVSNPGTYPSIAFIPATAPALVAAGKELRQIKDTAVVFNLRRPIDPTKFEFEKWRDQFREPKDLFFPNFVPVAIGGVLPVKTWLYQKQPKPWLVDSIYRLGPEAIRLGVFECDSRSDAHLTLYHLLEAQRVMPLLVWRSDAIGDILFYDSDDKSDLLLFARGNLVVRLQRNRGSEALLLQLAQIIDDTLVHTSAIVR